MSAIANEITKIKSSLPATTRLIAVSKTKPVEDLQQAYDAGQRVFGENKALEMRDKHEVLPNDIQWHFIGHLRITAASATPITVAVTVAVCNRRYGVWTKSRGWER